MRAPILIGAECCVGLAFLLLQPAVSFVIVKLLFALPCNIAEQPATNFDPWPDGLREGVLGHN